MREKIALKIALMKSHPFKIEERVIFMQVQIFDAKTIKKNHSLFH